VPLLYRLTYTDVAPPLGMFMGKSLNETGDKETLETMNKHLDADRRLDPAAEERFSDLGSRRGAHVPKP
jgi:hypothetical protein